MINLRNKFLSVAVIAALVSGCSSPVLKEPKTISTDSRTVQNVKRLGPVEVEHCNRMILSMIPISVTDPREMFEESLEAAKKQGGNSVVDFQINQADMMFLLLYSSVCMRATGTAAKIAD